MFKNSLQTSADLYLHFDLVQREWVIFFNSRHLFSREVHLIYNLINILWRNCPTWMKKLKISIHFFILPMKKGNRKISLNIVNAENIIYYSSINLRRKHSASCIFSRALVKLLISLLYKKKNSTWRQPSLKWRNYI